MRRGKKNLVGSARRANDSARPALA
jgi:hypothetical protein